MALSRKHYEAIAGILQAQHQQVEQDQTTEAAWEEGYGVGRQDSLDEIALRLADYFATENPHFDRERFLKAAGAN